MTRQQVVQKGLTAFHYGSYHCKGAPAGTRPFADAVARKEEMSPEPESG
jgi:hypothetical protein